MKWITLVALLAALAVALAAPPASVEGEKEVYETEEEIQEQVEEFLKHKKRYHTKGVFTSEECDVKWIRGQFIGEAAASTRYNIHFEFSRESKNQLARILKKLDPRKNCKEGTYPIPGIRLPRFDDVIEGLLDGGRITKIEETHL